MSKCKYCDCEFSPDLNGGFCCTDHKEINTIRKENELLRELKNYWKNSYRTLKVSDDIFDGLCQKENDFINSLKGNKDVLSETFS